MDYDVVTLIGVFEYASYYLQAEDPFRAMLKTAMAHVKPDGRLYIAIENRLGLKYFAGSAEDHTGVYFDGIENYPDERTTVNPSSSYFHGLPKSFLNSMTPPLP